MSKPVTSTSDWLIGAGGVLGAATVLGGFYEFPGTRSMNSTELPILAVHVTRNVAVAVLVVCGAALLLSIVRLYKLADLAEVNPQPYLRLGLNAISSLSGVALSFALVHLWTFL